MKLRRGQIVEVQFYDHALNASKPFKFIVYGRLSSITTNAICVDSWIYATRMYKHDSNVERHAIVRSAIISIRQLKPVEG